MKLIYPKYSTFMTLSTHFLLKFCQGGVSCKEYTYELGICMVEKLTMTLILVIGQCDMFEIDIGYEIYLN